MTDSLTPTARQTNVRRFQLGQQAVAEYELISNFNRRRL